MNVRMRASYSRRSIPRCEAAPMGPSMPQDDGQTNFA
jgi:hypothetical protein